MCILQNTITKFSYEESINRLKKLMDNGIGEAYNQLAGYYAEGNGSMPQIG